MTALLHAIQQGNIRSLARAITLVENGLNGYDALLSALPPSAAKVIGITGPPGAGKSTLVNHLVGHWVREGKKVAVLCVDPSSPFNYGAVLGDRVRMGDWYNHPGVYIRSLASRGSLGGLHPKIIEITDVVKAAPFDYVVVETVGVGQTEVDIAGLAEVTVVVLVPESGDEIQTMKAGLMEIADLFVVNKADRPQADRFVSYLHLMLAPAFQQKQREIPILKTIATAGEAGVAELAEKIAERLLDTAIPPHRWQLLAEKAFLLIQDRRMKCVQKEHLLKQLQSAGPLNLYRFVEDYLRHLAEQP